MHDTHSRILSAGAELFRRQGYAGTGMKAIAAASGAPLGSIYHFFPDGKDGLTAEVIRCGARTYGELIPLFFDQAPDLIAATRSAFAGAAEALAASGYADACPIATIALEVASTNEILRLATAQAFREWTELLADRFERGGLSGETPTRLATAFLVNLEGAFVLARAAHDTAPLAIAGDLMAGAVEAAMAAETQHGETAR